jgi:hypothetical protein
VIVPSDAPLQLTFVALADTVTSIGSPIVAVCCSIVISLAAVATTVYVPGP